MQLRELSDHEEQAIQQSFVEVNDWKTIGPFCVDGRDGAVEFASEEANGHVFVQALGGSLLAAVIQYISNDNSYEEALEQCAQKLSDNGFGTGVHRGSHSAGDASDCGFADNLQKILQRLSTQSQQIADLIDQAAPGVRDEGLWNKLISDVEANMDTPLASGESVVARSHEKGANLQTLDGDHAEVAAVVNLSQGTTLNTRGLVESGLQAFNLDLWYVQEQARVLGIDVSYATHAALGLYVATEMVLVEDKKQIRLPILINQ